jgi:hypothetical protein
VARIRPPDHLSADVLAREDFVQACTSRDLGEVLRLAMKWGGAGFSASHVGRRCEFTSSRVREYVRGERRAQQIEVFERVADGLRIPGVMLNLAARPWEEVEAVAEVPLPTGNGDAPVLRRDFVKLGAGVAATAVAGVPACRRAGTDEWKPRRTEHGGSVAVHHGELAPG